MFRRATNVCSEESRKDEIAKVQSVLSLNNYPRHLLKPEKYVNYQDSENNGHINDHSTSNQVSDVTVEENDQAQPTDRVKPRFICAPYVKGTSERVQRILNPYNIKLAHKSGNTIRS